MNPRRRILWQRWNVTPATLQASTNPCLYKDSYRHAILDLTVGVGMGVCYADTTSPLVTASEHGIWRAGRRCPDIELITAGGLKATRLYSEVSYGKYITISVGKRQARGSWFAKSAFCIDVLPSSVCASVEKTENRSKSSLDGCKPVKQFTATWVSEEDTFTAVVRPDMYIAYVGDVASCERYLADLFGKIIGSL